MKRILLALALLIGSIASAAAACTSPATMHDFPGATFLMSLATVPDGNCGSNVSVPTWAGGTLGAMANFGTSPGAVLVPGVNASSFQQGTWNITNISGTVSLPTGAATSANQATEITSLATIATNTGAAVPAGTNVIGFTSNDPCSQANKTNIPIATSAGNVQLVAGVASKQIYICSLVTVGAAASVQNIIEGTGAACTTANELAVIGSTTAASGMSFAANGGFSYGAGLGTVARTATAANGICLLQSGTTAIAGNLTYVQQ